MFGYCVKIKLKLPDKKICLFYHLSRIIIKKWGAFFFDKYYQTSFLVKTLFLHIQNNYGRKS